MKKLWFLEYFLFILVLLNVGLTVWNYQSVRSLDKFYTTHTYQQLGSKDLYEGSYKELMNNATYQKLQEDALTNTLQQIEQQNVLKTQQPVPQPQVQAEPTSNTANQ